MYLPYFKTLIKRFPLEKKFTTIDHLTLEKKDKTLEKKDKTMAQRGYTA